MRFFWQPRRPFLDYKRQAFLNLNPTDIVGHLQGIPVYSVVSAETVCVLRGPIVTTVDDWSAGCDGGGVRRLIVMTYALPQSSPVSRFLSLSLKLADTHSHSLPLPFHSFVLDCLFCFMLCVRMCMCSSLVCTLCRICETLECDIFARVSNRSRQQLTTVWNWTPKSQG